MALVVVVCLVLSSIAISIGVRKFADLSSDSIEPTVVFVDDGIASVRGIDSIVLNDSGQSGKHFEPLFMEFEHLKRRSSRNISIDVVGADGMADPNDIAEAIKIAIEKDADLICIALAAVKYTEQLRHQIGIASMYGVTVVAATQSGLEKIASYPASFGSVMGVYPLRSAKEEYWFSNGIGAALGVVVPPTGGSSLAAILVSAKLLNCKFDLTEPANELATRLIPCTGEPDVVAADKAPKPK